MPGSVLVRTQLASIFVRRAQELGLDVGDLVSAHGLGLAAAEAGDVAIGIPALRTLLAAIADRARDPHFGLNAAMAVPRGAYGVVEYLTRIAPTLRGCVEELARWGRILNHEISFDAATGMIAERVRGSADGLGRQGNEFSLALQLRVARESTGAAIACEQILFANRKETDDRELVAYFGTRDLSYDAGHNGIQLAPAELDRPVLTADQALARILAVQANDLANDAAPRGDLAPIRDLVGTQLRSGDATAVRIAKLIGMSERTLHRRLSEAGTTFGELVDDVRRSLTIEHLGDPERSLPEIAALVGYSDPRALARAFKRWTGSTPNDWRRKHARR